MKVLLVSASRKSWESTLDQVWCRFGFPVASLSSVLNQLCICKTFLRHVGGDSVRLAAIFWVHLNVKKQPVTLTVIFPHAAELMALGIAVELVGVGLAEVLLVGHAQTQGGVEDPVGGLAGAGLGRHGQTARS